MEKYYLKKEGNYYSNSRIDIIDNLPNNVNQRILELGCGGGDTLVDIKKRNLAKEVIGIELMELQNSNQTNKLIDKIIIGDIEKINFDFDFDYFDVIICADVLEHTVDPWGIIEKLSPFLKKGGLFIISLPNIRDFLTLFKIIFLKDFKYDPNSGVLDKTHLRFFCKKNILSMGTTESLKPVKINPSFKYKKMKFSENRRRWLNIITFGFIEDLLTTQYIIISEKIK